MKNDNILYNQKDNVKEFKNDNIYIIKMMTSPTLENDNIYSTKNYNIRHTWKW
jgi:hypothetical protein